MNTAPHPKDVQEFLFKQASVSQICSNLSCVPIASNLVAVDKKRGLLYVAHDNILTILTSGSEVDTEHKIESSHPFFISKLSFSCDYSYLAITTTVVQILIYDASNFTQNSKCLHQIQLSPSNAKAFALDLRWNPSVPGMLCTVANDYTIGSFEIKDGKERLVELKALEKLNGIDALCLAWSPKGKQIVVGCKNGNIVQLKPDLKVARTIVGPNPYIGEVISILWISNYQFCAAYLNDEKSINVLIIDAPKGETNAIFTCYEDITYGMFDIKDSYDIPRYYFDHVPEWGIIIAASSGSSEVAVLGSTDGGSTWNQWQLIDSGRAELPLIKTTESYPVGLAIDRTPTQKLAWGTDTTLPHPVPMIHILGTSGQLCSFHMVNLTPNCPAINSPPTETVNLLPLSSISSPTTVPCNVTISSAVTSTPLPKENQNASIERPKTAVANIFGDSLKAAGFFQQPQQTVANSTEEKNLAPIKVDTKPDIPQKPIPQEVEKVDSKVIVAKEINIPKPVEQKVPIDDSIYVRAYTELHTLFEKELQNRLESQSWECGSEEEWKQLGGRSAIIDQFLRDLRETTNSLSTDIAYLKALLLQSFAWVEEAKSKNALNVESTTRNCENSKIAELQRLFYYTQSQLTQANKVLDFKWSEHLYQSKSKMKIPSLEFLYQNLVLHNKIIMKEKNKIEQLTKKWKSLNRTNKISGLNQMMSSLKVSPKTPGFHGNTDVIDARCKAIASKTLSFTCQKQMKLKDLLTETSPKIIKPTNPSPIQDRLEATLSSLASLSPVNTDSKNKTEQSTPKYNTVGKQAVEGLKSQSPLALLNNVVAKIGTSEAHSVPIQNRTQQKQASNIVSFPAPPVNKFSQADKNSSVQQFPESLEVLPQPLSKSDVANVDITAQKTYNNIHTKSLSKDAEIKNDNQVLSKTAFPKPESISFSGSTLTNTLPLEFSLPKSQSTPQNASSSSTVIITKITEITKSASFNKFSFSNQNMLPQNTKTSSSNVTPVSTSAETFSFVSNVLNTIPLPATNQSPKELLDLMGLFLDLDKKDPGDTTGNKNVKLLKEPATIKELQPSNAYSTNSYAEPTFNDTTYGQNATKSTPEKIFEASSTTSTPGTLNTNDKTKSIFGASNIQIQPLNTSTLSTPTIFSGQPTTSTTSIFGGNSISASTAPNFAIAKTTSSTTPVFGIQTTVSSPTKFDGFSSTPAISAFGSTTIASTTSPFYSSLSKPTFGQSNITLTTANTITASTTSSTTLTFSSATTASYAAPTFGKTPKPTETTSQFPTTTSVSSVTSIFDKAAITSTSMPFNSSSNTSVFGGISTPSTASTAPVFGSISTPSTASTASVFGSISTPSTASTASVFGGISTPSTASTASVFGGISTPSTASTASVFGGISTPSTASTASVFGGISTPSTASTASVFGGISTPSTASTASVFGGNGTNTVFGRSVPPTTNTSIFGGNSSTTFGTASTGSIFDQSATKPQGLIFGGGTTPNSTSLFGGSAKTASPAAVVNSPSGSLFGGTGSAIGNAGSGSTSIFGGSQSNISTSGSPSVFGTPVNGTSPIVGGTPPVLGSQPVFGPAPAFGAKPVFGSPPGILESSKPLFGSMSFGTTFGSTTPGGFGSPPSMGGSVSPLGNAMPTVFGNTTGSSTFESLASQSDGLTFGSLAQKSPEAEKPAFSGGSSFSNWR